MLQEAVNTAMLTAEQLDTLSRDVINIFCSENEMVNQSSSALLQSSYKYYTILLVPPQYFTYAWLVLFPEAVVYLHKDFFQMDYDEVCTLCTLPV